MTNAPDSSLSNSNPSPPPRLFGRGFLSLLTTQFFGAANDNILKQCLTFMVATGIWSGAVGEGGLGEGGQVVPALLLTVPFILLSGYAGQVADRYSKRAVIWAVKFIELPIALVAFVGFYLQNLWLTLFSLLLLSIQSSFFGPAKYGAMPEVVDDRNLSMGNGILNMFTNLAVIVGSLAAGPLCDRYDPEPSVDGSAVSPMLSAPGIALVVVALLGILSVLPMPSLPAAKPGLQWNFNPFATYIEALREMGRSQLLRVTMAWSWFYMIGMMALMIVPEYEQILDISYEKASWLLGVMGVGIAVGSVSAGLASRRGTRPGLVVVGAVGMATAFAAMGILQPTYGNVIAGILAAGVFAGFYIVPLQAQLQGLAPETERGRFLGTANAMSFCLSSVGALLFWIATNRVGLPANRVHLLCGVLSILGLVLLYRRGEK